MFIEHQFMPDIVLYTKDVRVNLRNLKALIFMEHGIMEETIQ